MRKLILAMLFGLWSSCAAAGIYWLPDYLKDNIDTNHRTDTDTGGGDIPLGCEKYSPQCSSPHILGGIEIRVAGDLFCPMECICPDSFRYTTANCSGDKKLAGSACDGKYNDCVAKSCAEKGLKDCNGSCIAKSACCTDNDCGSDQKCSSGSCIAKTCEDKGQKTCNGSCIAKSACCTDSECGSDQKCSSGSCVAQTCEDKGQKTCNGSCIAKSACCTDSDCGTNQKCSSGSCVVKTCEEMGQKTCNGKCIGSTACCVSDDCPSGKKCFDNVCIAQTCEDKGLKTCGSTCIANSECCGGCGANQKCENGTCVNTKPSCVAQLEKNWNSYRVIFDEAEGIEDNTVFITGAFEDSTPIDLKYFNNKSGVIIDSTCSKRRSLEGTLENGDLTVYEGLYGDVNFVQSTISAIPFSGASSIEVNNSTVLLDLPQSRDSAIGRFTIRGTNSDISLGSDYDSYLTVEKFIIDNAPGSSFSMQTSPLGIWYEAIEVYGWEGGWEESNRVPFTFSISGNSKMEGVSIKIGIYDGTTAGAGGSLEIYNQGTFRFNYAFLQAGYGSINSATHSYFTIITERGALTETYGDTSPYLAVMNKGTFKVTNDVGQGEVNIFGELIKEQCIIETSISSSDTLPSGCN